MTIPPQPFNPPPIPEPLPNKKSFERPHFWVAPVFVLAAVSAGYAIPWNFDQASLSEILIYLLPLFTTVVFGALAAYHSYRITNNWKFFNWLTFSIMVGNCFIFLIFFDYLIPNLAKIFIFISTVLLLFSNIFGTIKPNI